MKKKKLKNVYVWTWICDFGNGPELCRYAESSKGDLIHQGKPTPEAKPKRVVMGLK